MENLMKMMKMMKMIGGIRGIPIKKETSRTENGPSLKKKPPSRTGIFQPPFEDKNCCMDASFNATGPTSKPMIHVFMCGMITGEKVVIKTACWDNHRR
jgi:hypothetical protein